MFAFASLLEERPARLRRARRRGHARLPLPERRSDRCSSAPPPCASSSASLSKGVRLLVGPRARAAAGRRTAGPRADSRRRRWSARRTRPVQDAARRMVETGATCVVVDLGDRLGIVTDRDIRSRVVAAGRRAGHAALRRDERAGVDGRRRPHRDRGAARDARPRRPPPAGARRRPAPGRGSRRRRPDGERAARARSACGRRSRAARARRRWPRRPRSCRRR